jgi:AcrR family transcriptional regulator
LHRDVIGVNMDGVKDPVTPTRATYHHGDLRRTLLEAALKLVAERGPEGFSLREAARGVGVSPAAAYRHFADKPELLAALAAEGHGRLAAAMEKASAKVEAPDARARAIATLITIGQAYVEFAVKNPSFFRVMFGSHLREAGYEPACAPSGRDAYGILSAALDELVAAGAMPQERRPGAEIPAWSVVHGFSTLLLDGALPFTGRQRSQALQLLWRSILLALGCDPALVSPAPPGWSFEGFGPKDGHPHPPRREQPRRRPR